MRQALLPYIENPNISQRIEQKLGNFIAELIEQRKSRLPIATNPSGHYQGQPHPKDQYSNMRDVHQTSGLLQPEFQQPIDMSQPGFQEQQMQGIRPDEGGLMAIKEEGPVSAMAGGTGNLIGAS